MSEELEQEPEAEAPPEPRATDEEVTTHRKRVKAQFREKYRSPHYKMSTEALDRYSWLVGAARRNRAKGILDIGCGRGEALEYAKRRGFAVQGYEIIHALCSHDLVAKFDGIHKIPEEDNSWDVISVNNVLEHLHPRDLNDGLKELKRVAVRAVFAQIDLEVGQLSLRGWMEAMGRIAGRVNMVRREGQHVCIQAVGNPKIT